MAEVVGLEIYVVEQAAMASLASVVKMALFDDGMKAEIALGREG